MNWDRWSFTLDNNRPAWAMDRRHVEMLEAIIRLGRFWSIVEIGLLLGRSTTALVEARPALLPVSLRGGKEARGRRDGARLFYGGMNDNSALFRRLQELAE